MDDIVSIARRDAASGLKLPWLIRVWRELWSRTSRTPVNEKVNVSMEGRIGDMTVVRGEYESIRSRMRRRKSKRSE